jgi:hypothetical protein
MHDSLKIYSLKLLLSLIEGPVQLPVYEEFASAFDDFVILTRRMEAIYEQFVTIELGLPEDSGINFVQSMLRKESF